MALPNGIIKPSTSRQQIIDGDKNFTTDLTTSLKTWGFLDVGFNYDVVSVFGSQSTGKSTLLNGLFGTTFDVMSETQRQQTTKGIWMSPAKDAPIMVMDVEGTDGRERGEDQDFERKAALFSLASTEVLIVNLWEHQVGLYQGANMGLLKTVFEVNLALFGSRDSSSRTLLLFVIRDHVGATPLSNLQATLIADLTKIWDSISKPEGRVQSKLDDYFDMSFVGLAHKVLRPDQFQEDVARLKGRFIDRSREDFVFKPAYHKRIPADGVAHYMESVWEQVQSNKDLDLPTQQELLAQFRCDEIAAGAMEEFGMQSKPFRKPIEGGQIVEELGKKMRSWKDMAITRFDTSASRYHKGVYTRKREGLVAQLNSSLSPLFLGQLKNLHRQNLTKFKQALVDGVRVSGDYDFGAIVVNARQNAESAFETEARECAGLGPLGIKEEPGHETQPLDPDWAHDEEFDQLKHEMGLVADQFRKDETKKMINAIERTFKKQISEPVEVALSKAKPDMWDRVLQAFKESLTACETTYLTKAKSFNSTEAEDAESIYILRKRAWLALRSKVDEQTADAVIVQKLRNYFEERFRYDEKGVPKVWRPEDDIDGAFARARDKTLELVPFYAKIYPTDSSLEYTLPKPPASLSSSEEIDSDFDFTSTKVIFSETKQMDIQSRFRRDADAFYVEAKRSIVSSVAQIPMWMYAVLVVLGWNEAMMVLFNPLYFTLLLIALGGSYAIFKLGLTGPLIQVTRTVTGEVQRQAGQRLREHFSQPVQETPVLNRPISRLQSNASVYEMPTQPGLSRRSTATTIGGFDDELEMKTF
ncbi:Dynamin-like GTPase that mediates homotypic ER fusion [Tulasnella sp. JGI-2019a]|nr:Dynamin-like GTPase that mediates homotypic ER fusion [Tulasnella sp. JGI-2019a]